MCVWVVVLLGGHMRAWSRVADFCNFVLYHVCVCVDGVSQLWGAGVRLCVLVNSCSIMSAFRIALPELE